ncbi:MAG: hypothetical protein JO000_17695 [Alphaproteobacteria bacterium]|nr:hypothetical protein [Alphaproteobacteria bacterium]
MLKTRKTARNLVLAAAALLTLGTASLATSTDASAFGRGGFHGGFPGGFHGGYRFGGFHGYRFGGYRYGWNRFHWNHYRYGWNRWGWNNYRWRYCHFYHTCYRPWPILGGIGQGPIGGGVPTASMGPVMQAAVAPAKPACLLKQYGPDGAVIFIDRCTQESAISPPPGAQGPQAPQGPAPQQQ